MCMAVQCVSLYQPRGFLETACGFYEEQCVASLALVYSKARWCSTCTTTSASLEPHENCGRVSSKVVSRNRVLMMVEDNCSVSAA